MNFSNLIFVIDVNVIIHLEKVNLLDELTNDKNARIVDLVLYQEYQHKPNLISKKISKITGKKLIRINTSKYFKYKTGKFVYLPSPDEFLSYIKYADIILTDSFHGTCFSLIYNKNFIDILKTKVKYKENIS